MGDNQNFLKECLVLLMKTRFDTNELSREYDELEGNLVRVGLNFNRIHVTAIIDLVDDLC